MQFWLTVRGAVHGVVHRVVRGVVHGVGVSVFNSPIPDSSAGPLILVWNICIPFSYVSLGNLAKTKMNFLHVDATILN